MMNVVKIYRDNPAYPSLLKRYLADGAPEAFSAIGNLNILQGKSLAIFSSIKCPGDIIIKTYDLMCQLRDAGVTVIGGFHSPMEQECLNILLKGKQPVVICPARNIEKMKIKVDFKKPLEDARLLILSPFSERENRITTERVNRRNRFIAAMANTIFIAHAEPEGKTEQLCREIIAWDKPLYTIDSNANKNLLSMTVAPITGNVRKVLDRCLSA